MFIALSLVAFLQVGHADMFSEDQAKREAENKIPTPCEKIEQMCSTAGFSKQTPKATDGTDLDDDCFGQVLNGKSVKGVSASDADIQQCLGSMPKKGVKGTVTPHSLPHR